MRGLYQAYDAEAERALVLDEDGNVAEGPGLNVFGVANGGLMTPAKGVLPRITRRSVFDLCHEMGIVVKARAVAPDELRGADEMFVTSTAGGIMPVSRIDGRPVGDGQVGAITRVLTEAYWAKHDDPAWSERVTYLGPLVSSPPQARLS